MIAFRPSARKRSLIVLATALQAVVLASAPASVQGQFSGFGTPVSQSDMLYLAGEPGQAYDLLQGHLAADSTDYDALWRAARAAVVLGIEADGGSRDQNQWLDPAMDLAERAVRARPDGIDGRYWRGVAVGRRAMNASPGYAVELAQISYDDAHAILAVDSLHGGAHNMLGKLNYEIMSLSRIKRGVARTFMSNPALDDTSWENAEYHLARAADVWPGFVLFHFDLGQLYRKRDRRDEAIASFRRVLELPAVHPTDHSLQGQAREILTEWDVLPDSVISPGGSPTAR